MKQKLKSHICEYLTPKDRIAYYKEDIEKNFVRPDVGEQITIGEFTYGKPSILYLESGKKVSIGKFCSIGYNVQILVGGNHRYDW